MKDDEFDSAVRKAFATQREQESVGAPSFQRVLACAHAAGETATTPGAWRRRSLAGGLMATIVLMGLLRWIDPVPDAPGGAALSEALPRFLESDPADERLFAALIDGGASPTDSLLPLHLRITLF